MQRTDFTGIAKPKVFAAKDFNKIFGIGYNKTGTTTLAYVLSTYGYRLPNQIDQEIRLTRRTFKTDYTEMKDFCQKYDAFQDLPFSQADFYIAADALFPNSKFILTERDPEIWFASMNTYYKEKNGISPSKKLTQEDLLNRFNYLFPGYSYSNEVRNIIEYKGREKIYNWDKLFEKEYYINLFIERNDRIKKYFSEAPDKLLCIDITRESSTRRLCEFLNIPVELSFKMPHVNKTPK
jgi:hypothetical protein